MIFELLFFVVAVVILARAIKELRRPSATKTVTRERRSPELAQLETYAAKLFAERKYAAAEKSYLRILKLNHKDPDAYRHLGKIYLAIKKYDDAIECFQIAAQLHPSGGDWYNLGLAYFENANYIKAIAAIDKSIMFEPTAAHYCGLAKVYEKIANYAKAISSLEQAAKLEPNKKVLTMLADCYAKNHDREKAIEVYHRVLRLDPNDAKAKRLVGSASTRKSQPA